MGLDSLRSILTECDAFFQPCRKRKKGGDYKRPSVEDYKLHVGRADLLLESPHYVFHYEHQNYSPDVETLGIKLFSWLLILCFWLVHVKQVVIADDRMVERVVVSPVKPQQRKQDPQTDK